MAHLTCEKHGKRVQFGAHYPVLGRYGFTIYHRNTGDGAPLVCNSVSFRIGEQIYLDWELELFTVEGNYLYRPCLKCDA